MDRRRFLASVGATATTTLAGCAQDQPDRSTDSAIDNGAVKSRQPRETTTPEMSLPGDPSRTQNTSLDVQKVAAQFGSESEGFSAEPDEHEFEEPAQASFERSGVDTYPDDDEVGLEVSADHLGTGRASGLAAGSFQTAWEAPADGQYRLSAEYVRHADVLYDRPDRGDISASFDTSLLAIRYRDGEVISDLTHPELQHKNGRLANDLAEFFLSTGATVLIGNALGLGLVGRLVLGRIIDRLIDLDQQTGTEESQIYDVYHRVQPNYDDPIGVTTDFEATEGEVFIFELAPTLGICFEIQNSWWYQPTSVASFEWRSFYIERI